MNNWITQIANLEDVTREISIKSVLFGSLLIIGLTIMAISTQKHEGFKKPLFWSMAFTITLVSVILAGSTVYLNVKSESKGPVHWHADFEFWACDTEIGLRDPYNFLSNKIGTTTYHEHNDKRIHLEGVVLEKAEDASLGKFMDVVGGDLSTDSISIPVNSTQDYLELDKDDGDTNQESDLSSYITDRGDYGIVNLGGSAACPSQADSQMQVYVYQTNPQNSNEYWQIKLDDPATYTITEEDQIPTGDCVIFEYGPLAEKTNKLCKQLGVRDIGLCEQFGVADNAREICTMREINPPLELNDA